MDNINTAITIHNYLKNNNMNPIFFSGECLKIMKGMPSEIIDCCITSPPYWRKRQYDNDGIGLEQDYNIYIKNLVEIFKELQRITKPTGSFWLNIGDSYLNKNLLGIPWRVAFQLMDTQGWILRNNIVWNKMKGGLDNSADKLRNIHEPIFHFVKKSRGYYYDVDSIRNTPKQSKVINGAIVSASGVSGVKYKRQIELSSDLTISQKQNAIIELDQMLLSVKIGEISDFRMIIKGRQRVTHSDSEKVSGRAKELNQKGYYFIKYNVKGSKPSDVWDIIPEDTQGRIGHFAPFPEDICKIPILTTCPTDGVVFDPFCGTGTTMLVAKKLSRKSIGIDISEKYIKNSNQRCVSYE